DGMGREGEGNLPQQRDPGPHRSSFRRRSMNGILQLNNLRRVSKAYRNYVEADIALPVGGENEILGRLEHPFRFLPVNKILGLTVLKGCAGFDLHEDEPIIALRNQVDLRLPVAVVAEENGVSLAYQVVGRQLLAFGAGFHFIGHDIVIPLNREISDYVSDIETH